MFQDAFEKLGPQEIELALADINPALGGAPFDAGTTTILGQPLPFYPGWKYLEVADHTAIPAQRRSVIHKPGRAVVLDGTNAPIYALNGEAPLKLERGNAADYVRFFFAHVRGRHGRFVLAETVEDIAWKEEPPPAARKAIGQMLAPLKVESKDAQGNFLMTARMVFRDLLFRAEVSAAPDGQVTLSNEELLIEDMPVLDDTFGQ